LNTRASIPRPGWSLRRRLGVALTASGLVAALLVAAAIFLIVSVRNQQNRVVNRYFNATRISNQLFTELLDAETAVRGYALTGDPATLAPFTRTTSAQTASQTTQLRQLLVHDPALQAGLMAAGRSAARWYEQWATPTIALVKAKGTDQVHAADVDRGQTLFDAIRTDFGRYSSALLARRQSANSALIRRTDLLLVTVVVAAVALVGAGIGLSFSLRRWILRPLDSLRVESRTVAEGALEHRVQVSGPAEVQRLGADVEAMRVRLVTQLADVEQAHRQVQASRDEISQQATELQRSNRDLEQFAYVASHDLQEPLRKVASFCQMLERRYQGQLDERADQYIAFAVDGAKRMQRLINDLLEFSRVGRLGRPLAPVALQGCLDQALNNLDTIRVASGAIITADPLPQVLGDEDLLVQLLQNLLGNAIKFRGYGPPHVHLGARRAGELWELSCADDGIGIDPQYGERVFVIFQRLHPRDSYEGTGIGLAMCKKIVEYHGGEIWLDTAAAESGATFRWTLHPVGKQSTVNETVAP